MKATVEVPQIKLNPGMERKKPCLEVILVDIREPGKHDVLSGRGVTTNKHPGNVNFRSLVALNKELYVTSTKKQKMAISRSIVEAVRCMDPPGRFLDKNPETSLWSDIGDRKAVEKTSQALRDGAANLRKQLSEDLADPDFLSAVFENDSGATSSTVHSDGSASSSNSSDGKKQIKSRTMKSKLARKEKGHRRAMSVPPESVPVLPESLAFHEKKVETSNNNGSEGNDLPQSRHARSTSFDHTAKSANSARKQTIRSASIGFASRPTQAKGRPLDAHPLAEEENFQGDASSMEGDAWAIGHSRNSSASSSVHLVPPFYPKSFGARNGRPGSHTPPQIFSLFQDQAPRGNRMPMSPMHRSWSPRDFEASPFNWRQSISGTTCYSEGDAVNIPSLDRTFDQSAFSMEEDLDDNSTLAPRSEELTLPAGRPVGPDASFESHEKLSISSNHSKQSFIPGGLKDATMDDSDAGFSYPNTLACDFGDAKGNALYDFGDAKGNPLDDVVMEDNDPLTDAGGMSPLCFLDETDIELLDNLPELLEMPVDAFENKQK